MQRYSRTFRVFVSSTFSDLKAERDALQERVFPRLRDLCFQHGCRFQAIDLRWGVSEEAALDQQTMNICLDELRRCQSTTPRPNFVILLGERYGWRPLPPQIAAEEFKTIQTQVPSASDRALLGRWYVRDDNIAPPQYQLRQRAGRYEKPGVWSKIERRLRLVLAAAARKALLPHSARLKYEAAATHQEIDVGALQAEQPEWQVFAFFRRIQRLPRCRAREFLDLNENRRRDREAHRRLERLKADLRRTIPRNVAEYSTRWTAHGLDTAYLERFCADVYARLSAVIRAEVEKLERIDPLDEEIAANTAFSEERARFFTGRLDALGVIASYLETGGPHPFAVHGASGTGKSALMAKAAADCLRQRPNYQRVIRFVGATPASASIRALLENVCREIRRAYGRDDGATPADYRDIVEWFKQTLALATAERPLALFIDALDQLSDADRGRNLIWLPADLPAHVRLIVSTLPGECLANLEKRLPPNHLLKVQPMAAEEGAQLLDHWLEQAKRRLQPAQRHAVLDCFGRNGLPLYLKLAFEESKSWSSSANGQHLSLPVDIAGMIRRLFKRLSLEANHGRVLLSRSLAYLAASRHGLAEDELLDVLARDARVLADFKRRSPKSPVVARLPVVVWSRLFGDLEAYLTNRQGDGVSLISFYHRQLGEEAARRFLPGRSKQRRHRALAAYFSRQWKGQPDRRALSELAFQQTHGKLWRQLQRTLTDLSFIQAKCAAGATYDLVADYNTAAAAQDLPSGARRRIDEFGRFVKAQAHVLVRRPQLAFQQAANEPGASAPGRAALARLHCFPNDRAWVRWLNKPGRPSPCLMVLVGHLGDINGCDIAPDGTRLVSAGRDQAIHVWDPSTGTELLTMFGHQTPIATCSYSPDGTCVASGGYDGSLKLWDPYVGAELPPLPGHRNQIEFCTFSRDGRRLISAGNDNTLRVWDVAARREIAALSLGKITAMACAFSPDGRRIVSGDQRGYLTLWDGRSYRLVKKIRAHGAEIMGCFFSRDGKWLFTASEDKTFKRWPAGLHGAPQVFHGHSAAVWSCAVSEKRGLIASASGDKTVKVWDARTGRLLATLEGHTDAVLSCSFLSAGQRLVTSSWDGTIRIWDLAAIADCGTPAEPGRRRAGADTDKNIWLTCGFSADGVRLAAGSEDDLRVWDAATGALLRISGPHTDYVRNCEFSPDRRWLLSSASSDLYRWNATGGSKPKLFRDHEALVSGCSISPNGRHILSSAEDGTLRLWKAAGRKTASVLMRDPAALTASAAAPDWRWAAAGTKDGRLRFVSLPEGKDLGEVKAHTGEVTTIAISRDGKLVATGSMDGMVKLWNTAMRAQIGLISGHAASILYCAFAPDGSTLATISRDTTLRIWHAQTAKLRRTISGHATAFQKFSYAPDGKRILSASYDGTLRLWNPQTGAELAMVSGFRNAVISGAFSPDGRRFVSASHDRTLQVTDTETGRHVLLLRGHVGEVRACTFSPDGARIVSASVDQTVRIWNAATGRPLAILRGHAGPVESAAFSPDANLVISASRDRTLRVWNAVTGRQRKIFSGHEDWITRAAFLADGRRIISCALDGTIRLWSLDSGRSGATLSGHADAVAAFALSPEQDRLLSGGGDAALKLWDLDSARELLDLRGHSGPIRCCAFAPDGVHAASVSMDRTLRLWDLTSAQNVMIAEHDSWLHACAFSADGVWLVSAGHDGLIKLWRVRERRLECEYWVGAPVRFLAWHPSEAKFVAGDEDGGVHILKPESG